MLGFKFSFAGQIFDDAAIGLETAAGEILRTWTGAARPVAGAMRDYLDHVARILVDRNSTPYPGGTTTTSLSTRTGAGVRSIIRSVQVKGTTWETLSGTIGGSRRLSIHETGGTIRAKRGMLTIPLPAALNSRGVAPPFARQWQNTFVARSKKGNLLIFQRRGVEIVPLYVLKPSVYIPARLGMEKELNEQFPYFQAKAADMVVRDFNQQLGG